MIFEKAKVTAIKRKYPRDTLSMREMDQRGVGEVDLLITKFT